MLNKLKANKGKLILSSILILLPILVGVVLWDRLPAVLASHWGADGTADGFMPRAMAVFAMPLFLLVFHWLGLLVTAADPHNREQNRKVFGLVFWICPIISFLTAGLTYTVALGGALHISLFLPLLLGVLFIVIGNYLPKCKQNHTIGIKIKWTLASEENWNATHRFGGKVWVIGGFCILAGVFLPKAALIWVLLPVTLLLAALPAVYSGLYYKKQSAAGTVPAKAVMPLSRGEKITAAVVLSFVAVVLVISLILTFSGKYELLYGDTAFTVNATGNPDVTVAYDEIDTIEYRDVCDAGSRVFGYGSPTLLMGTFENEEFGTYTRFSRPPCESAVVLTVDGKVLVLGGKNDGETKIIYENILNRMGKEDVNG